MQTTENKTYNGWTNYETWNVALWLGEEDWQGYNSEAISTYSDDTYGLSELIKAEVLENQPDMGYGMFDDLLSASLREVDFYTIAEHYIADAE